MLWLRPVIVHADNAALAEARTAVDSSDYMTARTQLAKALAEGDAQPDELAEIYKLTGIVEAALGNTKDATAAFQKWLALDPKASLPQGTSPKITRPFDAARKKAPKLELKTETTADPPQVTLVIGSDPIGITRARVLVSSDGKPEHELKGEGKGKISVDLPTGHRLDLRVEALDEHGNRVAVLGSKDVPIVVITSEKVIEPDHDHDRDHDVQKALVTKHDHKLVPAEEPAWYARWRVWGVAAGVGVLATGALSYKTYSDIQNIKQLNATSPDHRWADGNDAASTARRDLLITDIAAGVTGTLALGTLVFYLARPHEEVQVVAVPAHGGGTFAVGGHF